MAGLPGWIADWLLVVVPVAEVLVILGVAWLMVRALAWLLVQARQRGRLAPELMGAGAFIWLKLPVFLIPISPLPL